MTEGKGFSAKTEAAKNQLRRELRSPLLTRCAEWLIRLLLGAVLAGGKVLGNCSPFGVALTAACGPGSGGFAALLGASFGYLVSRGLEDGLRYTAAAILTFSVAFAFFDLKIYKKGWFMPTVSAALIALTGFVTTTGTSDFSPAALLGETALTAIGAAAFRWAFSLWKAPDHGREATPRQRLGLILLGAAALISLVEVELLGVFSLGRVSAGLLPLAAGFLAAPGAGAAVGLAAGLAMDLSVGGAPFYAVAYALCGLTAGFFRRNGRPACSLAAILAASLTALWTWPNAPAGFLYELTAAAFLFPVIPKGVLGRAAALLGELGEDTGRWAAADAARYLRETGAAFREIFSSLKPLFADKKQNLENPSILYDRAADKVCAHCVLRERCWQTDYQDTHDQLNAVLPAILESGQLRADHFPQRFRERCVQFPAFLSAVAEERTAYLLRREYQSQVGESRRAVCGQYGEIAQVLEEAAEAMATVAPVESHATRRLRQFIAGRELTCDGLVLTDQNGRIQLQLQGSDARELASEPARQSLSALLDVPLAPAEVLSHRQVRYRQQEPLTAIAGVAGRRRKGQHVTGDAGAWFKDNKGQLFLILCDGMGSGEEAERDSRLTIRLLEKFLRAGVTAENALKTLNQALVLRGEETGSFSTVDLLTLNLYTGQATLYKLGAAPSYLKRGGSVTKLTGAALPAGLTADAAPQPPDKTAFRLSPGDCLVLLTDGVLTGDDQWLKAALSNFDGDSPTTLAEQLVNHDPQEEDDKTALVLRLGLRET